MSPRRIACNGKPVNPLRREALRAGAGLVAGMALPGLAAAPLIERPIPEGEALPVVGLGTWQSFDVAGDAAGTAAAREVLRLFAAGGGRLVDSSPMYGSAESVVGDLATELGVQDRLFHATKVWTGGRESGIAQMEASLRRMRVARMDLMQVHNLVNIHTHLRTLREWKRQGRVRYIGVTRYHSGAYADLEPVMRSEELDCVQINYSLAEPDAERRLLPLAAERRLAVIVDRPFAEGALFDRVRGKPLPDFARVIGCDSLGTDVPEWILSQPAVTCVIPATRNPKHMGDDLGAAGGTLPDAGLRAGSPHTSRRSEPSRASRVPPRVRTSQEQPRHPGFPGRRGFMTGNYL